MPKAVEDERARKEWEQRQKEEQAQRERDAKEAAERRAREEREEQKVSPPARWDGGVEWGGMGDLLL